MNVSLSIVVKYLSDDVGRLSGKSKGDIRPHAVHLISNVFYYRLNLINLISKNKS